MELFSSCTLDGLALSNRIVVPPMCQYSADTEGNATDWHLMHYGTLALGGPGLVIVEATAVEARGRISDRDLGLWSDSNERALGGVLERIGVYSGVPFGIQLAHAGRKGGRAVFSERTLPLADGGWVVVGPSPLAFSPSYPVPEELTVEGIGGVISAFAATAKRAERIGFSLFEVHAAHGYLLHEFLSPLSNRRGDGYGGSLEGRMRLTLEVFEAVRGAVSAGKPVGIRISGSDWVEGGWGIGDSVELARELEKRGCSYIHVSGGGLSPDQVLAVGPGYQVAMAAAIRREVTMPVIAVGMITSGAQAETVLRSGAADLVAVGRGMLYDPRWVWHAAEDLGVMVKGAPTQWVRSRSGLFERPGK